MWFLTVEKDFTFSDIVMDKLHGTKGTGEVFGDLALKAAKSGLPRRASVMAVKDTHFAILNREAYDVD